MSAPEERGALSAQASATLRRRAAAVKPGEALTLTFSDGDAPALAGDGAPGPAKPGKKKQGTDQGSLF